MAAYVELQVCSNYSFLRGASRVEELMLAAKAFGYDTLAITDHNTLAGVARAHTRAAEAAIRLIVGCRLDLRGGPTMLAYPINRAGYGRLCRLLTLGKSRAGKEGCDITWADLVTLGEDLILILLPDHPDNRLLGDLQRMRKAFGDRCYVSLTRRLRPGDQVRLRQIADLGQQAKVPAVVTGDVLYHSPDRRILQDVVTCIREGCTIDDAGFKRERFAGRHLQPPGEMARLFADYPEALARSAEIAGRCTFSLADLRYQYPDELETGDKDPQDGLERLVRESIPSRYPGGLPPDVGQTASP